MSIYSLSRFDREGLTPLHRAVLKGRLSEIDSICSRKGVDINIRSRFNETPLMFACRLGYEEGIVALLDRGADETLQTETGVNAKALCLMTGHEKCALLLEPDGYTEEMIRRKLLAHFYGIKGTSSIAGRKFHLESSCPQIMYKKIAEFFDRFTQEESSFFKKEEQEEISSALHSASRPISTRKIVASIRAGRLTILSAGWKGHSVAVVFRKNVMAICNRGAGVLDGNETIQPFKIDPDKITEEVIEKIGEENNLSLEEAAPFLYYQLPRRLAASPLETLRFIAQRIAIKTQAPKLIKVGICSMAAAKAALLFSALVMRFSRVEEGSSKTFFSLGFVVREEMKSFFTYARAEMLAECIRACPSLEEDKVDIDLLTLAMHKLKQREKTVVLNQGGSSFICDPEGLV